ncbi:hypothetical protein [Mesorhizobium sp.]|uniref:hypothetical protein n=1 Tax=Mesorhizobium sp. TaxID=1871066 RepID=UPI0025CF832F|nr:hypothetical protein [Mesorhizobium sp.]
MNKIFVFHGKDEMPSVGKAPMARSSTSARVLPFRRGAPNFALRAVWRRDPTSGRLECRWQAERGIASEDGSGRRRIPVVRRGVAAVAVRRASSLLR